tara:strand:- start:359 stop:916 length:558 start_codon:yes stop_codon:yes gene_type:complete
LINIEKDTQVSLTKAEAGLAEYIGNARQSANRSRNIRSLKISDTMSDLDIDILGAKAELAFFKACNFYPHNLFDTDKAMSKKNKTDIGDVVMDGHVIDIKTTKYITGKLITKSKHDADVIDIFCLITQDAENIYVIRGFMPSFELITDERLGHLGRHVNRPCYIAEQKDLCSLSDCFKKMIDKAA